MELCGSAYNADAFSETARIIEQYFVFTDVKTYRRQAHQVAIEWRCLRIAKILFAKVKPGGLLESVTRNERICTGSCRDAVSSKGEIGPR